MYTSVVAAITFVLVPAYVLALPQQPVEGCHGEFEPTPETCTKFEFLTKAPILCLNLDSNSGAFYDTDNLPTIASIDHRVVQTVSQVTNVFEYSAKTFGFAECANIGDMRGFTCGYIGFTTGTNDVSQVVQTYTAMKPSNALSHYERRLNELVETNTCDTVARASTDGLDQFCAAWQEEACSADGLFAQVQKDWAYEHYIIPSARFAASVGVHSPLGQLVFYDTIVQHGYQYTEPLINIVRILSLNGPREPDESEAAYLTRFLTVRRQMQCCYPDMVWPASAIRSADLQSLVDNFDVFQDLDRPLPLAHFGEVIEANELSLADTRRCT